MSLSIALPASHRPAEQHRPQKMLHLLDIMLAILAIEMIMGGIIIAEEMIEARKVKSQIAQLAHFNTAVGTFYEKYSGLPGDLLAAQAERIGLPTGNGTPAHSDGDGKISPCSPGWQNGIGCENVLFWSQLAASELILGRFVASSSFADARVQESEFLEHYLPRSAMSDDLYLTVWSTDTHNFSAEKHLPGGNYFELTMLEEVTEGKLVENSYAIAPIISKEIDKKLDDGRPLTGSIVVNAGYDSSDGTWDMLAETDPYECVTPEQTYNTRDYMKAHRKLCHLAIAIDCCDSTEKRPF